MNKIVKEHVPVEALPEDWAAELPPKSKVRVEMTVEEAARSMTWEEIFEIVPSEERLTREEADKIVRQARDGWDDGTE